MIFAFSCTTPEKCARKYPPQLITKDSIVYKERIVTIYDTIFIVGDTITATDTVYVDKFTGLINSNPVFTETEFAIASAQVINSKIFLDLIQKDTAIARLLKTNIKEVEVYRDRTEIKEVFTTHWYDMAARWVVGILVLLIIIKIAIKL